MANGTERDNTGFWQAVYLGILIAALIVIVLIYAYCDHRRILEENRMYLEESSMAAADRMEMEFSYASGSLFLHAIEYANRDEAFEQSQEHLTLLAQNMPFDYVDYVGVDGVLRIDGAEEDVSGKSYFRLGMEGQFGMMAEPVSPIRGEPLIVFYAPITKRDQTTGVLLGSFSERHMSGILTTQYFGENAEAYLLLSDGAVIAQSRNVGTDSSVQDNILEAFKQGGSLESDKVYGEIEAALQERSSYAYGYKGSNGMGRAYMQPLEGTPFMLLETFPPKAVIAMRERADVLSTALIVAFCVLFALYLAANFALYGRKNRRILWEKVKNDRIVNSLRVVYDRIAVVDLEKHTYKFISGKGLAHLEISSEGRLEEYMAYYNARCMAPEDDPGEVVSTEALRRDITEAKPDSSYEYGLRDGIRWEELLCIGLSFRNHEVCELLMAARDITETKQREREAWNTLQLSLEAAKRANLAKSDFLSRMSHDIRTPMNAIIGMTAIAAAHMDDEQRVSDALDKINASSRHLLGIINDVLDMSKIESGKISLSEEEFNLGDLIDNMLELVKPLVKQHELSVNVWDLAHEAVIGDSQRIQQVFVNIMSNAAKYTPAGGKIQVFIGEEPSKNPEYGHYKFSFADNGIGMDKEFQEHIFEAFTRAEDERSSKIQGTGLGMAIAKTIVAMMGGDISLESEPGIGSTFIVELPLRLQGKTESFVDELQGLPVLVVDDDQMTCEAACQMLDEMGMKGEWALSGREAVSRVADAHGQESDYFAVIVDWRMPEMDGVETTREIRRLVGTDIPIVVFSAYDWTEIEAEARSAGVDAFISKPLFKSKLNMVFKDLASVERTGKKANQLQEFEENDFSGRRVLLVEDNELNREIAQEILSMTGICVETAEDGKEAVDKFEASEAGYYDLILMDVQMPVMNGYDATRAIRSLRRRDAGRIPIVAMTANAFVEDVLAAKSSGMNEHIAKPIELPKLLEVLHKWLDPQS